MLTEKHLGPDGKLVKSTPEVSTFYLELPMADGLLDVHLHSSEALFTFVTGFAKKGLIRAIINI